MKREYFIKNAKWYQEMLGFRVAGKFPGKGGHNVYFLENPSDGKMYEISQRDQLPGGATTRVDHIAYRSEELEKDYTYCKAVSVIIVKEIVLQKQNELSEYSELHEKYKKY